VLLVSKDRHEDFRLVFFQVTCGETHSFRLTKHPAGALLKWAIANPAHSPVRPLLVYVVTAEHFEKFKLICGSPARTVDLPRNALGELDTWVMLLDVPKPN
jgi:hypothetical protein